MLRSLAGSAARAHVGIPGPGPATALFRSARRQSTAPQSERKLPKLPMAPRAQVSREAVRARQRAARGGAPWREMNEAVRIFHSLSPPYLGQLRRRRSS